MPRANLAERLAYQKQWSLENPDKVRLHDRKKNMLRKYGLTWAQWEAMLAACNTQCQICNKPMAITHPAPLGTRAVPDHCHETGRVRGVLCHTCNKVLGMAGDNLPGVLRFVRYLEQV